MVGERSGKMTVVDFEENDTRKRKIVRGRIREQQLSLYGVLEISRMKSSQEFVSLEAKGTEFPVTKRRQNT